MAKTVVSVALDNPAGDPNINEGQTFSMDGTATLTGHGGSDYDAHHQWDQGTGTWVDIDSDVAKGLSTADTNPELGINGTSIATITVRGNVAGTYNVRIQTVDNNDGGALDTSGTQQVTVNESSRRIFVT